VVFADTYWNHWLWNADCSYSVTALKKHSAYDLDLIIPERLQAKYWRGLAARANADSALKFAVVKKAAGCLAR
jgi:hypothetical protein